MTAGLAGGACQEGGGGGHTCPEAHARLSAGGREREGRALRSKATTSCWVWDSEAKKINKIPL